MKNCKGFTQVEQMNNAGQSRFGRGPAIEIKGDGESGDRNPSAFDIRAPDTLGEGTMRNNEGFTLIELMIVVVILALLATIAIPNFIKLQERAKEAKVKGAAHTLQLAAEDFAVRNQGIYSDAAGDVGPLLPNDPNGGNNLENPFTRLYTEPVWAGAAATPGQIGIQVVVDATGTNVGYFINAWGIKDEIILLSSGN